MNNFLNKNSLLFALIMLLVVTSWWGQSETGANKQLKHEKEVAEAQLAKVEATTSETRQALQEKTAALSTAEKKLNEAEIKNLRIAKELSTKQSELTSLKNEEKTLLAKINELEHSLTKAKSQQAQSEPEQQKNVQEKLDENKETLAKLEKAEARIAQLEAEQTELKTHAEARIAQLQEKQSEVTTEAESLRAQVIGFEKVVEERNTTLAEIDSELQACKVNTKVLISKITEQEDAQQGIEEKMRLMVQNLSEEATHKEAAPEQEEQPAQAE
ncbi:MAG: hypothetical protein D3910_21610 [Candidatus Electrothrix sp. ATG2]|nr:hypothetical protein [Candidatus Electrothrix sp. ATG2]